MIRACSWCSPDHCGVLTPDGVGSRSHVASLMSNEALTALIGQPVKYFARMTAECRACLCAAGLVMKTCGWLTQSPGEVGVIGAGYDGCLAADQNYFRDYVASGRSLGRGSLFIYTLPSSTLGEVAIALALTGPGLHIEGERDPLETLARHAEQLVADGEADAILALWSDAASAVCLAIAGTAADAGSFIFPSTGTPGEAARARLRVLSPSPATPPPPQPSPGVPGEGEGLVLEAAPEAPALVIGKRPAWFPFPAEPDPTALARRLATLVVSP
jgi:hypothetical protein